MEQYEYMQNGNSFSIVEGDYYNKIYSKHVSSYGEKGANNIRDNIVTTFAEAMKQLEDPSKNNNMLLVGKVQSGKTSNLELFTALAFDNGYNLVVIYGGYDNTLLNQTDTRFRKSFDIPNEIGYSDSSPAVFTSDDGEQLLSVDDEIIEDLLDLKKPIFIISMKRPVAMSKVNSLLSKIDKSNLKGFVIDDEGDQASLNTKKDKANDSSATYAEIVRMKNLLNDPLYISVTATPQANIFLNEFSALRPDSIRLIEPGDGYCGAESYHLYNSFGCESIEIVPDDDQEELSDGYMPASLKLAIYHYFIASAIMSKRGCPTSEMIIHSHRNVSNHSDIYNCIDNFVQQFKDDISNDDVDSLKTRIKEMSDCYDRIFPKDVKEQYTLDELIPELYDKIVCRTYVILKNSIGKATQATESLRKHKIYIGGDLLQRGVTFPHLVTTYFLRWAADGGNMDTNLQRARWFGYRRAYIDLCKVFTTEMIAREFTTLSEAESDLWEQFYAVQNEEMKIEDLLVRADNTKQRPTRKNVVNVQTVSFKSKWIKQRVGIFDGVQVQVNNDIVDSLKSSLTLESTSEGRNDGNESAQYAIVKKNVLSDLIDQIQAVFNMEPFERRSLKELLKDFSEIPVIFMRGCESSGRKRSFYSSNKIYALHQGSDNKDPSKVVYRGDSFVVVDNNKVNIQIHKIVPMVRSSEGYKERSEFTQYMFAIYIPKGKTYFMRGD